MQDKEEQPMVKEVIFADMDGTLCDSCRPFSKEMEDAIRKLQDKGYSFVIVSGSTPQNISEQTNIACDAVACSGACIGDTFGNVHYEFKLTNAEKQLIIHALHHLINKYKIFPQTNIDDQILDRQSEITFSALGRHADSKLKDEYDPAQVKRMTHVKFLRGYLSDAFEIRIGGTTSIDITRKGVDKGAGVLKWCELNDYSPEDCIYIGDALYKGGNDEAVLYVHGLETYPVKYVKDTLRFFLRLCKQSPSSRHSKPSSQSQQTSTD